MRRSLLRQLRAFDGWFRPRFTLAEKKADVPQSEYAPGVSAKFPSCTSLYRNGEAAEATNGNGLVRTCLDARTRRRSFRTIQDWLKDCAR
jgi:hypothetical protein